MHDHYRHPPEPCYPSYSSQEFHTKREGPDDTRSLTLGSHGINGGHISASPYSVLPSQLASSSVIRPEYESTSQPPPTLPPCYHRSCPSPSMHPNQAHEYQSQPAPSGDQPTDDGVYGASSAVPVPKKKNTRASQACDSCRQLKAKCDEGRPCRVCTMKGTECKYRDPPPRAADKTQCDILGGITAASGTLETLCEQFHHMDKRLAKIENIKNFGPDSAAMTDTSATVKGPHETESTSFTGEERTKYSSQKPVTADLNEPTLPEDEVETEPGPPPPPGEPAIPMNHTARAGLLLKWSSIQKLTEHHGKREGISCVSEYPISQEQHRGVLMLYGRGEDNRMSQEEREREQHEQQSIDVPDDASDSHSPSAATDAADWATTGGASLGADGSLDFSDDKVWSYVGTFKEHILNMHPIVEPGVLEQWVGEFLDTLPISTNRHYETTTAGALSSSMEATGSKRKRSPAPDGMENPAAASPPSKNGRPNRSIHTALVLTVLALGKVCQHRDFVPDAVHVGNPMPHGRLPLRVIPPSTQGSSHDDGSCSQTSNSVSLRDQDLPFHRRRSSLIGNTRSGRLTKNYETIPGLEYFAFATDILGNHTASYNRMKNVYAHIFASLYQGQLGRPLESYSFIDRACHKLQMMMRPGLYKFKRPETTRELIQDTKYNQLSLAFWTCFQLESELIAELPVPPSSLLSYGDHIPHPNMSLLQGFPQPVLDSYLGQLYLRTHLNSIYRTFYAPMDPNKGNRAENLLKDVDSISDAVSGMNWVGSSLVFKENDPPASDILSARLRAKYWAAQVLTYRPFLQQILHGSYFQKHPTDVQHQILSYARKAIKALIESTRAFHGLGEKRPILTSVFSTAHAQWGNLLVLSAAFKDPIMHKYVDEELLRELFQKTIAFLRQSATATSSLRIDMRILEGLQRGFWGSEASHNSR